MRVPSRKQVAGGSLVLALAPLGYALSDAYGAYQETVRARIQCEGEIATVARLQARLADRDLSREIIDRWLAAKVPVGIPTIGDVIEGD